MRITPSMEELPHVGDDMRITCEIIGSDQFNRPQWQTPEGAVVPIYQAGRSLVIVVTAFGEVFDCNCKKLFKCNYTCL